MSWFDGWQAPLEPLPRFSSQFFESLFPYFCWFKMDFEEHHPYQRVSFSRYLFEGLEHFPQTPPGRTPKAFGSRTSTPPPTTSAVCAERGPPPSPRRARSCGPSTSSSTRSRGPRGWGPRAVSRLLRAGPLLCGGLKRKPKGTPQTPHLLVWVKIGGGLRGSKWATCLVFGKVAKEAKQERHRGVGCKRNSQQEHICSSRNRYGSNTGQPRSGSLVHGNKQGIGPDGGHRFGSPRHGHLENRKPGFRRVAGATPVLLFLFFSGFFFPPHFLLVLRGYKRFQ